MAPRISSRGSKRILIGSVSLLLLAVLALWIIDITAKRRWQSYLEDLKSRGLPITYAEAINTDIPDEDNAAVLWDRAVAESWAVPDEVAALSKHQTWSLARAGVLAAATPEFRAAILAELEANAEFIDVLHKIAACPSFTYTPKSVVYAETFDDVEPLFPGHTRKPQLPGTPSVTRRYRFLSSAAVALALEGRFDEAFDLLEVCLSSSRHYVESPCTQIAMVCGIVMRGELARACMEVLKKADLTKERSQALITFLDPIKMRDGFRQAMNAERVWSLQECGEMLRAGHYLQNFLVKRGFWGDARDAIHFAVMKYAIVDTMIESQEKSLQICQALDGPVPQWLEVAGDCGEGFACGGMVADLFATECRYQVLRLGIASKAYRKEHGEWPTGLDALVPEYFAALPLDPFTDTPFVYEIVGDSVRISWPKPDRGSVGESHPDLCVERDDPRLFAPAPI